MLLSLGTLPLDAAQPIVQFRDYAAEASQRLPRNHLGKKHLLT